MAKKPKETTHRMGKHSGYSLINGVYHIAPMYVSQFEKFADRRAGIDRVLKCITTHAMEVNEAIAEAQRRLWNSLIEDLGLDKSKGYSYKQDGTIREIQEEKKEANPD